MSYICFSKLVFLMHLMVISGNKTSNMLQYKFWLVAPTNSLDHCTCIKLSCTQYIFRVKRSDKIYSIDEVEYRVRQEHEPWYTWHCTESHTDIHPPVLDNTNTSHISHHIKTLWEKFHLQVWELQVKIKVQFKTDIFSC